MNGIDDAWTKVFEKKASDGDESVGREKHTVNNKAVEWMEKVRSTK